MASNPLNSLSAVLPLGCKLLQTCLMARVAVGLLPNRGPLHPSYGGRWVGEADKLSRNWGLMEKPQSQTPFQRGRCAHRGSKAATGERGSGVGLPCRDPKARAGGWGDGASARGPRGPPPPSSGRLPSPLAPSIPGPPLMPAMAVTSLLAPGSEAAAAAAAARRPQTRGGSDQTTPGSARRSTSAGGSRSSGGRERRGGRAGLELSGRLPPSRLRSSADRRPRTLSSQPRFRGVRTPAPRFCSGLAASPF